MIDTDNSNLRTVSAGDQVKAYTKKYTKKFMPLLKEWMQGESISKLVVVIMGKKTGEHVKRWVIRPMHGLQPGVTRG